ncbi:hypothetical protein E4631_08930 [Hymenobacter sp. UV11]|uniref:TolC family protein n=1 Tax=Hymenobacter sp. UV11 TaxID=1849735 RepID=UPI00105BD494|nr:TolC family protein [Hymenobacter sp. UV11]TDN36350.1 hypothetical protein A8B98_10635 [Hymenobacter sp. UV11]TFZ67065.1 hypothetical protein E4631_08930 [Hymenobacter sp. UV11]
MTHRLIGSVVLALHASMALAQAPSKPAADWQTTFFEVPGVTLPLLTTSAIQHSAAMKTLDVEKSINQQDIKIVKKNLLSGVALGASYTYGNLASVGYTGTSTGTPAGQVNAPSASSRYYGGLNLSLPVDQLVNHGALVQKQELNLQRTQSVQKEREAVIREQVIQLYQNVLLAHKVLTLRQDSYVNAQTNSRLAEKQFRQGQLTLVEFSQTSGQFTDVSIAQESARNQYDTSFMLLEEYVGDKIANLISTR